MRTIPFITILCLSILYALNISADENVPKRAYPGGKCFMFRVQLTDKSGSPFSLERPLEFLSQKSLDRRARQHLQTDSTDLPVSSNYQRQITANPDIIIVCKSKWNNTLLVRSKNLKALKELQSQPCVKDIKLVWTSPDSIDKSAERMSAHDSFNKIDSIPDKYYGSGNEQISMLKGIKLHRKGFTGRGMTIAVLDGGFMNLDILAPFRQTDIIGYKDFVYPPSPNLFKEIDHGTKVLSTMAANVPYIMVGTAPEASYLMIRSEDYHTESLAEQDFWAAAAEYADSMGVDVINSSLGYYSYDNHADDIRYRDLDGKSTLISRTASMLASKGIILVNSAGNAGMGTWKKISVPADATDILSVGAIGTSGINAGFSSVGPSADGRVKPDVMSVGMATAVITGRGTLIRSVGTSFASPTIAGMVACLWQALPELNAIQIMDLVRRSSNNFATPDNIYGYGVPNFEKAYENGLILQKELK
jgi:serine protease AprX